MSIRHFPSTVRFSVLLGALSICIAPSAFAAGGGHGSFNTKKELAPAERYSGSTPIDLTNGIKGNNGTYGKPNADYESISQAPALVPGLSEQAYPYARKQAFIQGVQESASFIEAAIQNWKAVSPDTKPEAKEYSEKSVVTMEPLLNRLHEAVKKAASASESDWSKAEENARQALIELRGTYSSLHRNVK